MADASYTNEQTRQVLEIQNLVHALADSQDSLDFELFGAVWRQDKPCTFDVSRHLPDYKPAELSAAELVAALGSALSGFEGTQHALSNMVVQFADDGKKATVRNNITAYHFLDLADGQGTFTTMRGRWEIELLKEDEGRGVPRRLQLAHGPMGDWMVAGIKVSRTFPLEGRAELYGLAKERAQRGEGRSSLTAFTVA